LWNRFFQDLDWGLRPWGEAPSFELTSGLEERENEYLFHAEMPGFDPDEIDVKVAGKTLSVRAERKEEQEGEGRSSCRYGSFQRQLTLPQGVDEAGIDARYHQGVLEIRLPKTDEARGKRIAVNTN
jgi:HSP20 family protein